MRIYSGSFAFLYYNYDQINDHDLALKKNKLSGSLDLVTSSSFAKKVQSLETRVPPFFKEKNIVIKTLSKSLINRCGLWTEGIDGLSTILFIHFKIRNSAFLETQLQKIERNKNFISLE